MEETEKAGWTPLTQVNTSSALTWYKVVNTFFLNYVYVIFIFSLSVLNETIRATSYVRTGTALSCRFALQVSLICLYHARHLVHKYPPTEIFSYSVIEV